MCVCILFLKATVIIHTLCVCVCVCLCVCVCVLLTMPAPVGILYAGGRAPVACLPPVGGRRDLQQTNKCMLEPPNLDTNGAEESVIVLISEVDMHARVVLGREKGSCLERCVRNGEFQ